MRFWIDTEFIEDGRTIDLLSIGVVAEDNREYYAELEECDRSRASPWVVENVFPQLNGALKPRVIVREELFEFFGGSPKIWGYNSAYDWVALCQLWGRMVDLPYGYPWHCRDIRQLAASLGVGVKGHVPRNDKVHNALDDARWVRDTWNALSLLEKSSVSARTAALR